MTAAWSTGSSGPAPLECGPHEPSGTRAVIDLAAYRRNLEVLSARVAPAQLMAVVKADAYGHGLLPVAQAAVAAGMTLIGVLDADSGMALRSAGIGPGVRLFAWLFGPHENYRQLIDADIDLGISYLHQLERIGRAGGSRAARVHLKLDTGLHRNGATIDDWPALVTRALELQVEGVVEVYGVWTHIGEASDDDDSAAIAAFRRGIAVAEDLGARFRMRHLAASAAAFARADARFDAVRIGAFTYGIAPGDGIGPKDIGLEAVMTLESEVAAVEGDGGRRSGRIPIGYLDGVPATAGGRVEVSVGNSRYRIDTVNAAESSVDVSGTSIAAGDRVVLFGNGDGGEATLQEWADSLGTIGEELAVMIGPRVDRRYVEN